MHAIRQREFGPPDVLRLEELPDPEPGPGQVRIAVAAAGVHRLDTAIRAGVSGGPFPLPELPMTPGRATSRTPSAVRPVPIIATAAGSATWDGTSCTASASRTARVA